MRHHLVGSMQGWYNFQSDCQLTSKGAAIDNRHRVLKDAKAYADTLAEAPDKKRESSLISPTYGSVDPRSSFPTLAATQPPKRSSRSKPSSLAMCLNGITSTVKWTSPTRSLPPPQVPLLLASHTTLMLHTTRKRMLTSGVGQGMCREMQWHTLRALHRPPQPRGLSLHRNLPLVMFMQRLTVPRS